MAGLAGLLRETQAAEPGAEKTRAMLGLAEKFAEVRRANAQAGLARLAREQWEQQLEADHARNRREAAEKQDFQELVREIVPRVLQDAAAEAEADGFEREPFVLNPTKSDQIRPADGEQAGLRAGPGGGIGEPAGPAVRGRQAPEAGHLSARPAQPEAGEPAASEPAPPEHCSA